LSKKVVDTPVKVNCVPTFRDGGGPYYKANAPFRSKIAPSKSNGEVLRMKGKVIKSDCVTPIANAVLDIWQANESGNYEDEWYRGQVRTDNDGDYTFETVIPKGYGEGTGYRPPHLHFKVSVDGNEVVTSQMFFPEIKGQAGFNDAYIMKVESTEKNGKPVHNGYHDIVLP
jgi:catechol 1,2-dioxygenase